MWMYEDMTDHRSYTYATSTAVKLKSEKNSGLNGIRTHDLCDNGAVLYQLSYQANWELVTFWVRNIPVGVFISFSAVQVSDLS